MPDASDKKLPGMDRRSCGATCCLALGPDPGFLRICLVCTSVQCPVIVFLLSGEENAFEKVTNFFFKKKFLFDGVMKNMLAINMAYFPQV